MYRATHDLRILQSTTLRQQQTPKTITTSQSHQNISAQEDTHNSLCTCTMLRREEQFRVEELRSRCWQMRREREHVAETVAGRVSAERRERSFQVKVLQRRHQRVIRREESREHKEKRLQHDYVLG